MAVYWVTISKIKNVNDLSMNQMAAITELNAAFDTLKYSSFNMPVCCLSLTCLMISVLVWA